MENNEVNTNAAELLESSEVTEAVETVGTAADFEINPMNFVTNLSYMGLGMLGIMIVMAVIIGATALLNRLFRDKSEKKADDAQ